MVGRHEARQKRSRDRKRTGRQELTAATHNVRTMAANRKYDAGRAADVLDAHQKIYSDIIFLGETRRCDNSVRVQEKGTRVYGELG